MMPVSLPSFSSSSCFNKAAKVILKNMNLAAQGLKSSPDCAGLQVKSKPLHQLTGLQNLGLFSLSLSISAPGVLFHVLKTTRFLLASDSYPVPSATHAASSLCAPVRNLFCSDSKLLGSRDHIVARSAAFTRSS